MSRTGLVVAALGLLGLLAPSTAAAVHSSPHAEDAVVVISGDVFVDRNEIVDGVFIVSGDARIAGRVDGDVVVLSGDVKVTGTIDGNLFTASGLARLLPSAEVTGDVSYGDERPVVSTGATVGGHIHKESWPDPEGLSFWIGGFLLWLVMGISAAVLGLLLLLVSPRAADAIFQRTRERIGPLIAIGIAIAIVLPLAAVLAAITVVGLPLGIAILLALLPLAAIAYVVSAWALGRTILRPPRNRYLSFLVGIAILHAIALVPIVGLLVGLAAVIFGLGLVGAAIGAAREAPASARPAGG